MYSTWCSCNSSLAGCGSCCCGGETLLASVKKEVLTHSAAVQSLTTDTNGDHKTLAQYKPMSEADLQAQRVP